MSESRIRVCLFVEVPEKSAPAVIMGAWAGIQAEMIAYGMTIEEMSKAVHLLHAYFMLPENS